MSWREYDSSKWKLESIFVFYKRVIWLQTQIEARYQEQAPVTVTHKVEQNVHQSRNFLIPISNCC